MENRDDAVEQKSIHITLIKYSSTIKITCCTHLEELAHVVRQRRQGKARQVNKAAQEHQDQQDGVSRLQVRVGDADERLALAQDARERVVPGAGQTRNGVGSSQAAGPVLR